MFQALADAIEHGVAHGELQAGDRLPTHRDLAEALGISVGAVTRGYAEAERRSLVKGVTGRGTFIAADAGGTPSLYPHGFSPPDIIDLGLVTPTPTNLPQYAAALRRVAARPDVSALFQYHDSQGLLPHRTTGAAWLRRFGIEVSAENVVVTSGGQHALACILNAFFSDGDTLLADPQTYPGMKSLAHSFGVKLAAVPGDERGMLPDELESACRREHAKGVFLMPSACNPTTACMDEHRRRDIAKVLKNNNLICIEDEAYGTLKENAPPALSTYAPGQSIYIASLSKILGGGLRTAFLAVPDVMRRPVARAIQLLMWMPAPLMAELTAGLIESGEAEAVLRAKREETAARYALAQKILDNAQFAGFPDNYFIWMKLPAPWTGAAFEARAREAGVSVFGAERFCIGCAPVPRAVRISLSAVPTREELKKGLHTLRDILAQGMQNDDPFF